MARPHFGVNCGCRSSGFGDARADSGFGAPPGLSFSPSFGKQREQNAQTEWLVYMFNSTGKRSRRRAVGTLGRAVYICDTRAARLPWNATLINEVFMQNFPAAAAKTAAALAIGDELLSGRTKDKNIAYLAEQLDNSGLDLREARIVPDEETAIITALNALRASCDYVFASGGIGPTHDDITAQSVAKAFSRPCIFDPRAEAALEAYYRKQGSALTEGRRLMARMPEGAELIANSVSGAPGFRIDNCFVMAGVPQVFQAMLQTALSALPKAPPMERRSFSCPFGESLISRPLSAIQRQFPQVSIGSYPQMQEDGARRWRVEIALRSRSAEALRKAAAAVQKMLADLERGS